MSISEIKKEYARIKSSVTGYKCDSTDLSGHSLEGGTARFCRGSGGAIPLVEATLYGEMYKTVNEYYFKNGGLFFLLSTTTRYNVPMYLSDEAAKESGVEPFDLKKATVEENRFYFSAGRMILWLGPDKKPIDRKSPEFSDKSKEHIAFSKDLMSRISLGR